MSPRRSRRGSQAMVEFALLVPILLLLAVIVLDGGGMLRELVVLQDAARAGARVAATAYGPTVSSTAIADAVLAASSDLGVANTSDTIVVGYPDTRSVRVVVRYDHPLQTPLLRQVWGGPSGAVRLEGTAWFYLPQLTPAPSTIVPSTPTNTPTPTSTPTPVPTATPQPTDTPAPGATPPAPTQAPTSPPAPTPPPPPGPPATATPTLAPPTPTPAPLACTKNLAIPALAANQGYWVTIDTAGAGTISATWTLPSKQNAGLYVYAGTPFLGQPNPLTQAPPAGALASDSGVVTVLTATTPSQPPGTYTLYFYKRATALAATTATTTYTAATCP